MIGPTDLLHHIYIYIYIYTQRISRGVLFTSVGIRSCIMFDDHLLSQFSVSNVFCQHSIHVCFASTQTTGTWTNMRLSEYMSRKVQFNPREGDRKAWPRYILITYNAGERIPVAARPKAWVCGRVV